MQIVEYKDRFEIFFKWDFMFKHNVESVKAVPGRTYNPTQKFWLAPITSRAEVEQLKFKCRATLQMAAEMSPEKTGTIAPLKPLTAEIFLKEGVVLREYQQEGVQQMIYLMRCINGDDMGLGKTIQAIAASTAVKPFPLVIVCPASLKLNWYSEIKKFSHLRPMILEDKVKNSWIRYSDMGLIDIFITNLESMHKYFVQELPKGSSLKKAKQIVPNESWSKVRGIIIDESQRLRNSQTRNCKVALRLCYQKEVVWLLTGTPVVNKPDDLWPQLCIMNRHHHFGKHADYQRRYCGGGNGASNLRELNYYLNKVCYFGRKKKDVLKDLPEKQRQTLLCEISTRNEYDFAYQNFVNWLKANGCTDAEVRKKLRGEILVKMNALRQLSARGKIEAVCEFIEEITDAGEKVVIFCNLHEIIDKIKAKYPRAVTFHGKMNETQRHDAKTRFQTDPSCDIIICNYKSGGVGLTLTAASNVGFVEYPWTWADCLQCEDRTYRIGQMFSVLCRYFMGKNTIDQRLFEIIQGKKEISEAITGGSDDIPMGTLDALTMSLFEQTETV